MTNLTLKGKPDAGNPLRASGCAATPGRGLLFKKIMALAIVVFSCLAYADNLREIVVAAGGTPLQGYGNILNNDEDMAARAFDGVCTNVGDVARCLGGNGGSETYVVFGIPAGLLPAGKKVAVTRYRVYQQNGGSSANLRAPRSWTLSGSQDNSTFSDIDSQSGVLWYSDEHEIDDNAQLPAGVDNWLEFSLDPSTVTDYLYFKFTPTASKYSIGWNYSFEEIEFYGTIYDESDGYCVIDNSATCVGDVHPYYGDVTATGATFTVSSREVVHKSVPYSLAGWKLEKWQNSAWVETATGTEATYTYTPDGSICRFSWVWDVGSVPLDVTIAKDIGCESVTRSPASATGEYEYGTVVTLTACPASTPHVSTFVRWQGDLPEGVDETSSEIEVTMDAARSIEAVFDRTGWPWMFTTDGASLSSGTLTDGNWKFGVAEATVSGLTGGELATVAFGDGMLDLTSVKADTGLTLVSITNSLFAGSTAISGVKFNNELRRTGSYSFAMSKVSSVQFGTDLTTFGDRTFYGTKLDSTVDMSMCTNVTEFLNEVFFDCQLLKHLVLPPRLSKLNYRPIASCSLLETITCSLPPPEYLDEMKEKNLSMGSDPIGNCPNLERLELPCGGVVTFANMRGLTKLNTLKVNGKAPTSVGDIFTGWSSTQHQPAYQAKIVVSDRRDRAGWEALRTREPTAEERQRSDYPGPRTFGVLDAPSAARVWMVWGLSLYENAGFSIFVR